jgi:hypothetical protein
VTSSALFTVCPLVVVAERVPDPAQDNAVCAANLAMRIQRRSATVSVEPPALRPYSCFGRSLILIRVSHGVMRLPSHRHLGSRRAWGLFA